METIQHNATTLYNCDETGITIVQHKHTKILGLKGKRQISSLQLAERGLLVTVTCMSQTGNFISPLLVFPRKNMKQELMNGTPPGSIYVCHPLWWIQSKIFSKWFLHFISLNKYNERIMLISSASHLTAPTKCNLWIKLSWGPWKHSTANKLENGPVHTQGQSPSTKLAKYSEMHTSELQQAK